MPQKLKPSDEVRTWVSMAFVGRTELRVKELPTPNLILVIDSIQEIHK